MKRLRAWVTGCVVVLGLCIVVQMVVFGFARFTDARWHTLSAAESARELRVVTSAKSVRDERPSVPGMDVNRVLSANDATFRTAGGLTQWAGTLAVLGMGIMCMLGLVLACASGSAGLSGVDRTVTACGWAALLAVACPPWGRWDGTGGDPSAVIPSVLWDYNSMVSLCDTQRIGDVALAARYVFLPFVGLVCGGLVCHFFRCGVEQMIFAFSMSAEERAAQAEMASISAGGIARSVSRSGAAMNRLIEAESPAAIPIRPQGLCLTPGTERMTAMRDEPALVRSTIDSAEPPVRARSADLPLNVPDPGEGLRRPI